MTLEKWEEIKEMVRRKYTVIANTKEPLGADVPGDKEILVFTTDLGKIKLEWVVKPRTLGEKTVFSKRIGSAVKIDKVYDENETVSYLRAYQASGDEWQEIKAEQII